LTVASQVKQTLASLKSSESILKIYSNQTQVKETIGIYKEIIDVTSGIINDLEQRIQTLELQEAKYKGN
jgi:hypothetical protein